MKIQKFVKDKSNKYKVVIDDNNYVLYDDVILKYQLLLKDSISVNDLNDILRENDELICYYACVKYISKKLRSEGEVRKYLLKNNVDVDIINKTIAKLYSNRLLDNSTYLKAFVNDQINLTNNGPKKIVDILCRNGFDRDEVLEYIGMIDESVWDGKIDKYISKKIKTNHNLSGNMLKNKITLELVNHGYEKHTILGLLEKYDIIDDDVLKREYFKVKKTLEKKYSGFELNQKIKASLYRKGFNIGDVNYEE